MFLFVAASFASAPPPIVNGEKTSDYDEVVLLYMTDRGGQYGASCTGSLIAPNWVLTASHCITDSSDFNITQVYVIRADSMNEAGRNDYYEAKEWFAHPDYNGRDGYNDIALIELDDDLDGPFMPISDQAPKRTDEGDDFRLVGFGATSESDNSSNPKKRTADVPLYEYDSGLLYTWDEDDNQNACYGDSGGPVMRLFEDGTYAQAGVMDFVSSCEGGGLGSARVDAFLDFIDEYTEDYSIYGEEPEVEEEPEDDDDDDLVAGGDDDTATDDDDSDFVALDDGSISYTGTCSALPGAASLAASALGLLAIARRRRA